MLFRGEYSSCLSSDDVFNMDVPLMTKRAKGGTMIMWKNELDAFITPLQSPSSSFLPVLFTPPESPKSIHIAIYLPTARRDVDFAQEMASLDNLLCDFINKYPGVLIFIRGDANVNFKNTSRKEQFQNLCKSFSLESSTISHSTYHHFTGDGQSDSQLDVLLHSQGAEEDLKQIVCKVHEPTILSHHDLIVSRFILPKTEKTVSPKLPSAPRLKSDRVKICWSDEGIHSYLMSVKGILCTIRERWLLNGSEASFSVLLTSTYSFLDRCARSTNRYIDLTVSPSKRSKRLPIYLVKSARYLRTCYNTLKKASPSSPRHHILSMKLKNLKHHHLRLIRLNKIANAARRDALLDRLNSGCSSSTVFAALRKLNRTSACNIQSIKVGSRTYYGECVPDGIFDSIKELKT